MYFARARIGGKLIRKSLATSVYSVATLDAGDILKEHQRITHHDLRHLSATTCIESGVDVPTVARWLGHRDGKSFMSPDGRSDAVAQNVRDRPEPFMCEGNGL